MVDLDDECIHLMPKATCSICGAPKGAVKKGIGGGGSPTTLDTPESIEKYRARYPGRREGTFEAYKDVFFRLSSARDFPGGWTHFSRCANAEPALVKQEPKLVARAEELMRLGGYSSDDSGRPRQGRRWVKNT